MVRTFSPKELKKEREKTRKELHQLYINCIKTYLVRKGIKYKLKAKILRLIAHYVNEENIEAWFSLPVWLTVQTILREDPKKLFHSKIPY